jgi:xylose isomerase
MNAYNYWDERNYLSTCNKCGNFISCTRYCSRECWIKQREEYKKREGDKFNILTEIVIDQSDKVLYDILLLEPPKTKEEVKKQYFKLALKYHPDKNGDIDTFIKIKDAYEKLYNQL